MTLPKGKDSVQDRYPKADVDLHTIYNPDPGGYHELVYGIDIL